MLAGRDLATLARDALELAKRAVVRAAPADTVLSQSGAVKGRPIPAEGVADEFSPNAPDTANTDETLNGSEEEFPLLGRPGEGKVDPDANGSWSSPGEDDTVYLGLRVYTNKAAPAVLGGQLRDPTKDLSALVKQVS